MADIGATVGYRGLAVLDREDEPRTLAVVLTDAVAGCAHPERWTTRVSQVWAHADCGTDLPVQGWKLHVSATVGSAEHVLRACAAVLLDEECSFKVARDLHQVAALTGAHCPRGSAGKVLTAYPVTDEAAVALAWRLDAVTRGLNGPRILSDRPLRPGSLVHYRFGAFIGIPHVSHDGEMMAALLGPDGDVVPDRRDVGNPLPDWATRPFLSSPASLDSERAAQVLLGERFVVQEAIRHAYRGGVFRAIDRVSGRRVVIKQARAHVGSGPDGADGRARLKHEAGVLKALSGSGLTPQCLSTFEQDGDMFLVEEDIGGQNLRGWVASGASDGAARRPLKDTLVVLAQAASALAELHEIGVVVSDFGPNNILVTETRRVVLIDLELASLPGLRWTADGRAGTPGYGSPEQFQGASPHPSMDSYALGATILFAVTGEDPLLWIDSMSTARSWLGHGMRGHSCPPAVAELAVALCAADPAARPSAGYAADILEQAGVAAVTLTASDVLTAALDNLQPLADSTADDAIAFLIERLLVDVVPGQRRIATPSSLGESTLATNVQHGAAGILGTIVQAWKALHDERLLERAAAAAGWLEAAADREPKGGPVGLYFGYAGPCWALADAGRALGDQAMIHRAVERALALPPAWPGPDVTHGLAGLGLTLVHLWQVQPDVRLRDRVSEVAARLLDSAERDGADISWRTPRGIASTFAGSSHYGFAHGTAGIGLFLQHAALITGNHLFHDAAAASVETLSGAALRKDGMATWGSSPDSPAPGMQYWCNGSAGVGTFLVRYAALGGELGGELLDEAARAVMHDKWRSGISYCHGLAGYADFLLDLADYRDPRYRHWAADLLRVMWNRRVTDAGSPGLTDKPGHIAPDFNVGYCGPLAVLLRSRHGICRSWLPELPTLDRTAAATTHLSAAA